MKRCCLALLAIAILTVSVRGDAAQEKEATIAFLQKLQGMDGGFLPAPPKPTDAEGEAKSSLRATSSAVRALKYLGSAPKNRRTAEEFVRKCYDKASGGFADFPGGTPDVTTTAVGLMAAVELKIPVEKYQDTAEYYLTGRVNKFEDIRIAAAAIEALGIKKSKGTGWLTQVRRMKNDDGTYGKGDGVARDTAAAVVTVLRLGGELEHKENVVQAIKKGQREDGGYGKEGATASDLESTYRVARAFVMLDEKPDVARCLEFVASCRNPDAGYGVAPGQPSTTAATYFATMVQVWFGKR